MSRYNNTQIIINSSESYQKLFDIKKIEQIKQYSTFDFKNLKNFAEYNLDVAYHKIKPFDKLYNISNQYYSSPDYGWVILYTNGIGSEFDINIGNVLNIYFPLNTLLGLL